MQQKMSEIIIVLIAVSAIFALIAGLLTHTAAENDLEYDSESIDDYNKMSEMEEIVQDVEAKDRNISSNSDVDILGDIFRQGAATLRVTRSSIDMVDDMSDDATEDLNLGYSGTILKTTVILIFIIIVILAVFASALLKWSV